jgi:excinuclease UvrABC ATPase subunit
MHRISVTISAAGEKTAKLTTKSQEDFPQKRSLGKTTKIRIVPEKSLGPENTQELVTYVGFCTNILKMFKQKSAHRKRKYDYSRLAKYI